MRYQESNISENITENPDRFISYILYVVPQIDSCLRSNLTHLRLKSSGEVPGLKHRSSEVRQIRSDANFFFF